MKKHLFSIIAVLSLFISSIQFMGCSSKAVNENDPQSVYEDAEDDVKSKRYTVALEKLKNVKNKFPYSHLATQASLRMADVYFDEESYIEAASAYENFRDLHPKHEKADYVMFRIGESYYRQMPDTVDRDLTAGLKAVEAFKELATVYPKSQYAEKAKELSKQAVQQLADKEQYVADFYYKRDMFDSAARRYEKLASNFSGSASEEYAYWQWGQSLINSDQKDEAKHALRTYVSRFPNGKYASRAGDWLDQNGGR